MVSSVNSESKSRLRNSCYLSITLEPLPFFAELRLLRFSASIMAVVGSSSSLRKYAFAGHALVLIVLLLGQELGAAEASCNSSQIKYSLANCIGELNSAPDRNGQCCKTLQDIQNNQRPDDQCICGILNDPQVINAGLTKDKATTFIKVCVGDYALPSCLR